MIDVEKQHKLLKLSAEDITKTWGAIAPAIEEALPPTASTDEVGGLLAALLAGALECWAYLREDEDDWRIAALMTLAVKKDPFGDSKTLFMYTFSADGYLTSEHYFDIHKAIGAYARSRGCTTCTAITKNPRILQMAKATGLSTEYTYLVMEVGADG